MNIETSGDTLQTAESSHKLTVESDYQHVVSVLKWESDYCNKKVTVSVDQSSEYSGMQIEGMRCIGGVTRQYLNLNQSTQDFITDISALQGQCEIRTIMNGDSYPKLDKVAPNIIYTMTDIY
jgi:hypothetical protein